MAFKITDACKNEDPLKIEYSKNNITNFGRNFNKSKYQKMLPRKLLDWNWNNLEFIFSRFFLLLVFLFFFFTFLFFFFLVLVIIVVVLVLFLFGIFWKNQEIFYDCNTTLEKLIAYLLLCVSYLLLPISSWPPRLVCPSFSFQPPESKEVLMRN